MLDQVCKNACLVKYKIKLSIILGSTAAINKLADVLNLKDEKNRNQTVVFISTFEHHSNILPWKETNTEVEILLVCFSFEYRIYF